MPFALLTLHHVIPGLGKSAFADRSDLVSSILSIGFWRNVKKSLEASAIVADEIDVVKKMILPAVSLRLGWPKIQYGEVSSRESSLHTKKKTGDF